MSNVITVDENEHLYKIHSFRLERGDQTVITIEVFELIASELSPKFFAAPAKNSLGGVPKPEYRTSGDSAEDTLNACLRSISGINRQDLYEKIQKK